MRVLFDVVHPAHAHFYRRMIVALHEEGHPVLVVSRDKDVTTGLLDAWGIPHHPVGVAGATGKVGQLRELVARDSALWRATGSFGPDVVLTRSPAGVQVARARGIVGIFDTDDGRAAGVHFRAAAPFAHMITTPDVLKEDYGERHRRYRGYKALAYLHPDRYTPDRSILNLLGVDEGERYFVVRFVAMTASHDRNEAGLGEGDKRRIVEALQARGRVFVSSEGPLPRGMEDLSFDAPPERIHDALAFADLYVGDSQTMAAEAALLATPAIRASSWTGRLDYLDDLEQTHGLLRSFRPDEGDRVLAAVAELVDDPGTPERWRDRHAAMLATKDDVTGWYLDLVREVAASS